MGYSPDIAQHSGKHRDAKALGGFGGAGALEVVTDHRGDTFRAVDTVRYAATVFVLHAFQKKISACLIVVFSFNIVGVSQLPTHFLLRAVAFARQRVP